MMHRAKVTEPAKRDVDEIYEWLRERSPAAAQSWWHAFLATLDKIKQNPFRYAAAPEDDVFDKPLLQALFKTRHGRTYRALFVVREDAVYRLRVRSGGQDLIGRSDVELPN